MVNENLETIHIKTLQLAAMVSVLRTLAGNPDNDDLCPEVVGNYAWLMNDLLDEIDQQVRSAWTVTGRTNG
ncbi:hypothetical protein [Burkholderia sp. LMG 13014]|uniref:hypothetical protein n=1 Tax=Burkholderia sp. LMG 13014 TaxID=2709306 RepID=UPI0019653A0F|nr:hypothetical protein [Burkholderia sp. LMG 13014]